MFDLDPEDRVIYEGDDLGAVVACSEASFALARDLRPWDDVIIYAEATDITVRDEMRPMLEIAGSTEHHFPGESVFTKWTCEANSQSPGLHFDAQLLDYEILEK